MTLEQLTVSPETITVLGIKVPTQCREVCSGECCARGVCIGDIYASWDCCRVRGLMMHCESVQVISHGRMLVAGVTNVML